MADPREQRRPHVRALLAAARAMGVSKEHLIREDARRKCLKRMCTSNQSLSVVTLLTTLKNMRFWGLLGTARGDMPFRCNPPNDLTDDPKKYEILGAAGDCPRRHVALMQPP